MSDVNPKSIKQYLAHYDKVMERIDDINLRCGEKRLIAISREVRALPPKDNIAHADDVLDRCLGLK